jgi:hypothetical protein
MTILNIIAIMATIGVFFVIMILLAVGVSKMLNEDD